MVEPVLFLLWIAALCAFAIWLISRHERASGRSPEANQAQDRQDIETEWGVCPGIECKSPPAYRPRPLPPSALALHLIQAGSAWPLTARMAWLARQLHGTVAAHGVYVASRVEWRRNDVEYMLAESRIAGRTHTMVSGRLPGVRTPQFQIQPTQPPRVFPVDERPWDGRTGVPEFDQQFEIRLPAGSKAEPQALMPELAEHFVDLARLLMANPALAVWRNGTIWIALRGFLPRAHASIEALDATCRLVEHVLARARLTHCDIVADILWIGGEAPHRCAACGGVLGERRRVCAGCGAPCHPECARYLQHCPWPWCGCATGRMWRTWTGRLERGPG